MSVVIKISRRAHKHLRKSPRYVQEKFRAWLVAVQQAGLEITQKYPGWHDEALKGKRKGQRSIRLNKQWRVIYIIEMNGEMQLIEISEVTPHEY